MASIRLVPENEAVGGVKAVYERPLRPMSRSTADTGEFVTRFPYILQWIPD